MAEEEEGRRIIPPQEHPNYRPKQPGPHSLAYVENNASRRSLRNKRRITLFKKSGELIRKTGGKMFMLYIDDTNKPWVYGSDQDLLIKFATTGLKKTKGTEFRDADNKPIVLDLPVVPSLPESHNGGWAAEVSIMMHQENSAPTVVAPSSNRAPFTSATNHAVTPVFETPRVLVATNNANIEATPSDSQVNTPIVCTSTPSTSSSISGLQLPELNETAITEQLGSIEDFSSRPVVEVFDVIMSNNEWVIQETDPLLQQPVPQTTHLTEPQMSKSTVTNAVMPSQAPSQSIVTQPVMSSQALSPSAVTNTVRSSPAPTQSIVTHAVMSSQAQSQSIINHTVMSTQAPSQSSLAQLSGTSQTPPQSTVVQLSETNQALQESQTRPRLQKHNINIGNRSSPSQVQETPKATREVSKSSPHGKGVLFFYGKKEQKENQAPRRSLFSSFPDCSDIDPTPLKRMRTRGIVKKERL